MNTYSASKTVTGWTVEETLTPFTLADTRVISEYSQVTPVTQKCVCKRLSDLGVLPGMTQLGHSQDVISEYSENTQLEV